jgi:hypothetical protein
MSEKMSGRSRSKIQESIDKARAAQRLDIYKKRIDFAKQGIKAYEGARNAEAIKHFSTYLKILEEWHETNTGGLTPSFFNAKKDVAEMLLINGVYLMLMKIYDRNKDVNRKEFQHALEKYIVFSKGMPYQSVAADNLRKFINHEKPIHRVELMNAAKMIGAGGCFIATALSKESAPETLPTLYAFRDHILVKSFWGRSFIKVYYYFSPPIAHWLERQSLFTRKPLANGLDFFAKLLRFVLKLNPCQRKMPTQ